jgi:uncharacterized membrane protein HdeD (DUF308 family)
MVLVAVTEEGAEAARALLYALVVYGLLMAGLGIFLIVSPHEALKVVTVVIGVLLIVDGVIALVAGAIGRLESRGMLALVGVISVVAGLVLVKEPFGALYVFVTIVGIWFVLAGVSRLVHAFTLRDGRGAYIVGALIDVVAGVVILSWKDITLSTLAIVIGIALVIRGIAYVYSSGRLLRHAHAGDAPGAPVLPI